MFKTLAFITIYCSFIFKVLTGYQIEVANINYFFKNQIKLRQQSSSALSILNQKNKQKESINREFIDIILLHSNWKHSKGNLTVQLSTYSLESIKAICQFSYSNKSHFSKRLMYYPLRELIRSQFFFINAYFVSKKKRKLPSQAIISYQMELLCFTQRYCTIVTDYFQKKLELYIQIDGSIEQACMLEKLILSYFDFYVEKPEQKMSFYEKHFVFEDSFFPHLKNDNVFFDYFNLLVKEVVLRIQYSRYAIKEERFVQTGQLDFANFYLKQAILGIDKTTKVASDFLLSIICKQKKNEKDYLNNYETKEKLVGEISRGNNLKRRALMSAYSTQQIIEQEIVALDMELEQSRNQKIIVLLIFLILLLLVGFTSLFLYYSEMKKREHKKQKLCMKAWHEEQMKKSMNQIEQNEATIQELEEILNTKLAALETELARVQRGRLQAENLQIKYSSTETYLLEEKMKQNLTYKQFTSMKNFKPTEFDWQELMVLINTTYNKFTERLEKLLPNISIVDLRICCLLKIGVPPAEIARLMNQSRQSISMRRKRLYEKLFNKEGTPDLLDAFIKNF